MAAKIASFHHHIMGDESAGLLCFSENSWYESITKLCNAKSFSEQIAETAYASMYELYEPLNWTKKLVLISKIGF